MDQATAAALHRINRDFYSTHAVAFGATRSRPWIGWERALGPFFGRWTAGARSFSTVPILDVGCGNGRFAEFLAARSGVRLDYCGIDASEQMIQQAKRRLAGLPGVEARVKCVDLTDDPVESRFADRPFKLIVVFGVLHHIAGFARRRKLLHELAGTLDHDGLLAVSFWQFGLQERFRRRALDWAEHNRVSGDSIDVGELEPGDYLLAWGDRLDQNKPQPRRYCHFADQKEAEDLVQGLDLLPVDRFLSDGQTGDLNLYFVLQSRI